MPEQHGRRFVDESPMGVRIEYSDGTVVEDGKIVKIGPRAIVRDGQLVGWREEGQ